MTSENTPVSELGLPELTTWLRRCTELVDENAPYLTDLDAAIGDADHGANMQRGFDAVAGILDADYEDVQALMKKVGMTLVSSVGGASGPLYGTFFLRFATSAKGADALDLHALFAALQAGVHGIEERGKSMIGQKTMLDAWVPALDAYQRAGETLQGAVLAGAAGAQEGRDATGPMEATKGRASYLGERSVGHIDPGAASTALLWEALADVVRPGGPTPDGEAGADGETRADGEAAS
ncbi:dihydroxyacetone kinase subunit DhaL [Brachybacterium sp. ACRRE]|uniref:dihydroxyacetone kinase subunit DhaL n=1 Tax=Brachybacterium sp. ACRRE TaxID=2918184 RepID=UPI001EF31D4D|nr:dihydroxyacetone kinase subunit DhaL [Brachybacterium sp. ACRRE]MCG7308927.1 dihydroxyacetone kinase subunit L [Brachybacterium sp. ACRRE]